jgi:thiamine kinase-like enzyme
MIFKKNKDLINLVQTLLKLGNISDKLQSIEIINRGGNNQIYHINCKSQNFILKKYFQHPEDNRDRLNNEFNFLKATHKSTLGQSPKPISKNKDHSAALYEFIEGNVITDTTEITESLIIQSAQFIANLNKNDFTKIKQKIMPASEACFSIGEHINRIDFRILELKESKTLHSDNLDFNIILDQITQVWANVRLSIIDKCLKEKIIINKPLPSVELIISPSDFGFHNAIISKQHVATFIDFEYAGWDDPAKLVGDFFSQVSIKIDPKYIDLFLITAFSSNPNYKNIEFRAKLLLDLYKIKWCCIVLNIFLPKHLARREFANEVVNCSNLRKTQILKAKQLLNEITP